MITPETFSYYQGIINQDSKDFNMTIASSSVVLKAAGITDERLLVEADSHLFMRLFMRFLHKNQIKVFLFAENEAVLDKMKDYISQSSSGIRIIETATMEEHGVSDDMILNRINGAEAECIIAALSTPTQQQFAIRNRMLMNARVWIGLGTSFIESKKKTLGSYVKELLNDFFTKM